MNILKWNLRSLILIILLLIVSIVLIATSFASNNVQATNDPDDYCDVTVDQTSDVTVDRSGDYCILSFKRVGTTVWTSPAWVSSIEYLIVAGGGGGGSYRGGGGGGGGVLQGTTSISSSSQQIVVGGGGLGGYYSTVSPQNGSNSSAFGLTAIGGGRGGSLDLPAITPSTGGSGGGGGAQDGASQSGANGTSGQGNPGGNGFHNNTTNGRSGGGGGAGSAGENGNTSATSAGNGGAGVQSTITGSYYGGGGGGGLDNRGTVTTAGVGGIGGGGNGGAGQNSPTLVATDGQANTGGGGGGNGQGTSAFGSAAGRSGDGGSGIVVVKFPIPPRPSVNASQVIALVDPRVESIELPIVDITSWVNNRACITISNSNGALALDGSDSNKYKVEITSGSGVSSEFQGANNFKFYGTPAQISEVFEPNNANKSRIKITKPSSGNFSENITLTIRSDNSPNSSCADSAPDGDPLLTATIKPYGVDVSQKNTVNLN